MLRLHPRYLVSLIPLKEATVSLSLPERLSHPEYAPVDLRSLTPGKPLTVDLYLLLEDRYVPYHEACDLFTEADKNDLLQAGVTTLWVRLSDQARPVSSRQLLRLLALPDDEVPPLAKSGLLYQSAMGIARQTITASVSKRMLADVHDLVGVTIRFLARSPSAFASMFSVMQNDFSVYTHSVNVAVYALALARYTGIVHQQQLQELGLGAFLHDVGKARVPVEILGKAGPLSEQEWQTIRQHPQWGEQLLAVADDLPEIVSDVVALHHERLDGSGYPTGAGGADLPWFAKVVAVVDSVDAMTSDRPYRAGWSLDEALDALRDQSAGRLDTDLLKAVTRLLHKSSATREAWKPGR